MGMEAGIAFDTCEMQIRFSLPKTLCAASFYCDI